MPRSSQAPPLSQTLDGLLDGVRPRGTAVSVPPALLLRWQSCVGPFLAERTFVLGFFKGTLRIGASDPNTVSTLHALREDILEALQAYGPPRIRALVIREIPAKRALSEAGRRASVASAPEGGGPSSGAAERIESLKRIRVAFPALERGSSASPERAGMLPEEDGRACAEFEPLLSTVRGELRPIFERLLALHRAAEKAKRSFEGSRSQAEKGE